MHIWVRRNKSVICLKKTWTLSHNILHNGSSGYRKSEGFEVGWLYGANDIHVPKPVNHISVCVCVWCELLILHRRCAQMPILFLINTFACILISGVNIQNNLTTESELRLELGAELRALCRVEG